MSIVLITGLSKLIIWLLKLLPGNRGSALPGLVATSLDPNFVGKLAKKNQLKSIIITGTNGKTTTTKVIKGILSAANKRVVTNTAGSNMSRGIASAFIEQANWRGRLNANMGLFEVDEGFVADVASKIKPKTIVVLNLLRDHFDRYF